MKKWMQLLIPLLLLQISLFGQQVFHRRYTVNDGLPDNCIRTIFKDSRGYLWIGTDTGVSRFDGRTFTNWGTADGLSGQKVWAITEDWNGNMWFGTYDGGISVFDGNSFKVFNSQNSVLPSDNIRSLACFADTSLVYIGSENGVCIYNGQQFKSIEMPGDHRGLVRVMDFDPCHDKVLISFYSSGLPWPIISFDPKTMHYDGFVDKAKNNTPPGGSETHNVSQLLCTDSRIIYSLNRQGITELINGNEKHFTGIGQVFGLSEGINDEVWIAAWVDELGMEGGGLYLLKNDSIINFNPKIGLSKGVGFCTFYDKNDRALWYGSINNGLVYIPESYFTMQEESLFGFSGQKINDLLFDSKNRMWVAAPDTLYCRVNTKDIRKWSRVACNEILKDNGLSKFNSNLAVNGFISMVEDANGDILISASNIGCFKISKKLEIEYLNNLVGKIKLNDSLMLLGADIWRRPTYTRDYTDSPQKLNVIPNFPPPSNTTAVEVMGSDFWLTTFDKGLFKFSHNETVHLNETHSFLPKNISCTCILDNYNIVIGSSAGKLYFLDEENNKLRLLKTFGQSDGIIGATIRFIEEGMDNDLWIGTDKGLNHLLLDNLYNTSSPEIAFFDASSGFTDYTGYCTAVDRQGNIWIGTDNHIIKVDRSLANKTTTRAGKMQFSKFKLFNYHEGWDSLLIKNPWTGMLDDEPKLNYLQNYIGIEFKSLNYFNPEQDRFQYFLEGYDQNWSELSESTSAVYSSLPPGNYTFRVKAMNHSGQVVYEDMESRFTIIPPFWQRWWFYVLAVGLVLVLSWLFFGHQTRVVRQKERQKAATAEKMHKLEMKALKAQMNPHFVFNAITSIQNCILNSNIDSAIRYLSEFSNIFRMTLDNVNQEYISMQRELDYLNNYLSLEKLRFQQVFDVLINIDAQIDVDSIQIPPLIIQPHIENAIHHGLLPLKKDGKLIVEFHILNKNIIRCIIEDNGIGRTASKKINDAKQGKKHVSRGSRISKERIELYNRAGNTWDFKLQVIDLNKNNVAAGTRVILDLPLRYLY